MEIQITLFLAQHIVCLSFFGFLVRYNYLVVNLQVKVKAVIGTFSGFCKQRIAAPNLFPLK